MRMFQRSFGQASAGVQAAYNQLARFVLLLQSIPAHWYDVAPGYAPGIVEDPLISTVTLKKFTYKQCMTPSAKAATSAQLLPPSGACTGEIVAASMQVVAVPVGTLTSAQDAWNTLAVALGALGTPFPFAPRQDAWGRTFPSLLPLTRDNIDKVLGILTRARREILEGKPALPEQLVPVPGVDQPAKAPPGRFPWGWVIFGVAVIGVGGAAAWWLTRRKPLSRAVPA